MKIKECKDCTWWHDYHDRVFVRISGTQGDMSRDLIEARRCRYISSPTVTNIQTVYTDSKFVCGNWVCSQKEMPKIVEG